jgi:hypothetical protein
VPNKIPSSHLFSSDDVIDIFFNGNPQVFFLDSDSRFNCLNDCVKLFLTWCLFTMDIRHKRYLRIICKFGQLENNLCVHITRI